MQRAAAEGFGTEAPKVLTEAGDASRAAQASLQGITELENNLHTFDKFGGGKGFLTPGPGAGARIEFARALNTASAAFGAKPVFDPTALGAAEASNKDTTRLGFDLAKSLGSREAVMIVQQAIGVVPGVENTVAGRERIIAALKQAQQRTIDYNKFLKTYPIGERGLTNAADDFNETNPPQDYAYKAALQTIPAKSAGARDDALAFLRAHPETVGQFDEHFGIPGLGAYTLAH